MMSRVHRQGLVFAVIFLFLYAPSACSSGDPNASDADSQQDVRARCIEIERLFSEVVFFAQEAGGACTRAADCTVTRPTLKCQDSKVELCEVSLSSSLRSEFHASLARLQKMQCEAHCNVVMNVTCSATQPECTDGRCRMVAKL
jgi:hypothetical protein